MRLRINPSTLLIYFLGGILGLVAALIWLHFLYAAAGDNQERVFLYHLWQYGPRSFVLTILIGFVLVGFLSVSRILVKRQLKIQEAEVKLLQEVSQSKTETISFASHQMRTPVSAVKFSLKMLLEGDFGALTHGQRELLDKTYNSAENLGLLIGEFLDVSKLELGKLEISFKSISLAEMEKATRQTVERLTPLAARKKITLDFFSFLDYRLSVQADLKRINQIIENLLENAVDYTPSGGKIEVRLQNDKNNFQCAVSDTGIGIPKTEQEKIFTKFFRASNARRIQSTGSGLGLYLCKRFIEGHDGKIWLSSEEGRGTTFHLTIPIKIKTEAEELFRRI